jgi:hypothetical protein
VELVNGGLIEGLPSKTFTRVEVDNADLMANDGSISVPMTFMAPAGYDGQPVKFDVFAESYETDLSGGELTTANNRVFTGITLSTDGAQTDPTPEPDVTTPSDEPLFVAEDLNAGEGMDHVETDVLFGYAYEETELDPGAEDHHTDVGNDDDAPVAGADDPTNDLFIFGVGAGDDYFNGGAGWADTVQLQGIAGGPSDGSWALQVSDDTAFVQGDHEIAFGEKASGTIELNDGSTLTFENVDKIKW